MYYLTLFCDSIVVKYTQCSSLPAYLQDPWWNPAVEEQAVMRVHRIGQTQQVMIKRFIVKVCSTLFSLLRLVNQFPCNNIALSGKCWCLFLGAYLNINMLYRTLSAHHVKKVIGPLHAYFSDGRVQLRKEWRQYKLGSNG